jgi:hypothetical protein
MTSFQENLNNLMIAVNQYEQTGNAPSKETLQDIFMAISFIIEFHNDGFTRLMTGMREFWIEMLEKHREQRIDPPDSMIRMLEYLDEVNRIITSRSRNKH